MQNRKRVRKKRRMETFSFFCYNIREYDELEVNNMANNMILRLIQQECKEQKFRRKKLCYGICSLPHLSQNTRDNVELDKLMLEAIMQRLGISTRRYMFILRDSEYSYFELREQTRNYIWNDEIDKAETCIEQYLVAKSGKKSARHLHQQVALLLRSYVMDKKKEPYEKQLNVVREALAHTKVNLEEVDFQTYAYGEIELLLIMRGAMLLESMQESVSARSIYQKLYEAQKKKPYNGDEFAHIFAKVNYQMAKYSMADEDYEKVLEITDYGIKMLAAGNKILYLWELMELYLMAEANLGSEGVKSSNYEVFKYYKSMKNVIGKYYKDWNADTHYPMYYERRVYSLRKMIAQRRRLLGETQESISRKNHCDYKTIERLEQGKNDTQTEIRYQLLNMLGLPPEKCYHMLVADNISVRKDYFKLIEETDRGNLKEARRLLDVLKENVDLTNNINIQAIELREFGIEQKEKKWPVDEEREKILELLSCSLPLTYLDDPNGGLLYGNEENLVRRLIKNYEKSGETDRAIELTKRVLNGYQNPKVVGDEFIGIYLGFANFLENMYANIGLFGLSDEIIRESLKKCIQHDFIGWMEFLLYDLVWNRSKQGIDVTEQEIAMLDVAIMIAAIKNYPERKEFIDRYKKKLQVN